MTAKEICELLAEKQYKKIKESFADVNVVDLAELLEELPERQMIMAFRLIGKEEAAETFSCMEPREQQILVEALTERELRAVLDDMFLDDTADLLEEMPANVVERILSNTDAETRRQLNQILSYPDDSVGSIMTVEYVALKESMTVEQAIEHIRSVGLDSETINICYVLDAQRRLVGTVALRYLLISDRDEIIGELMHENVISIHTLMDQEQVAAQFKKYDFIAMPVVDNENRLVGIITVDDIVDILEEENTEDMEKMAAIVPSDKPYMKTGVGETFKKRFPWLLLLMVSSTFTQAIINSFEAALSACVVLTAFIPMLMGTGGNAGGQASVTVIRGLSLGEIEYRDVPRIIWKEVRVAVLCGVCLAAANFAKLMIFDHVGVWVALVICFSLIVVVLLAMFVGCILPIGAKRVGFDPAVMASPFITTIVDALSLLVYFRFATWMLGI